MEKIFKNICRVILVLLSISMLDALSFQVYAYEEEEEDIPYLKSIYLSEGKDVEFKKNQYEYIVDVLNIDKSLYIKAKPDDDNYTVEINGTVLKEDEKYKYDANLIEGKNKFTIKVTDEKNDLSTTYYVYVYRGGEKSVYLKNIKMNGCEMGFDKETDIYNIEIDKDTEYIKLNVETEDKSYSVFANGNDKCSDLSKDIRVNFESVGKYIVDLEVKDNETNRSKKYTLQFYVGIPVTDNPILEVSKAMKKNQWIIVNGRWRYNNALGECLKDTWFFDPKYQGYFYFNFRGNMETGWLDYNGESYYLQENGAASIGWKKMDGYWYYFDKTGLMKKGWVKDKDKWYYLNSNGRMKKGWITDNNQNYYLETDGAMKIGWMFYDSHWYYFNDDGSMKSGEWLPYCNQWYYINRSGTMRTGWLYKDDKYYYLNPDGTMRIKPLRNQNYIYIFNNDGSVKMN